MSGRPKLTIKYQYRYAGRPTKLTEDIVHKLEEAASIRATTQETLYYVGIAESTYYKWLKENPQLSERLEDLRHKAFIIARTTIIGRLNDVGVAFKFLEKEKPEDYAEHFKIEHSGKIGTNDSNEHPEDEALRLELKERLVKNMQKRARDKETLEPHAHKA